MDETILLEKIHYAKICEECTLLHGLINNCSGKNEILKLQGSLPKGPLLFSKILKFSKIPSENPRWNSALVAGHRPSYLLNCAACCPCNFETAISRNIFD